MCGIFCLLEKIASDNQVNAEELLDFIKSRGPDAFGTVNHVFRTNSNEEMQLSLNGSVLWIRGELTKQPVCKQDSRKFNHMLLWNGEIFGGDLKVGDDENDTQVLLDKLLLKEDDTSLEDHLLSLFSTIHGPWAFLYFNEEKMQLWYGRDYFGRRSLTINQNGESLIISSIAFKKTEMISEEVPAKVLYCMDLNELDLNNPQLCIKRYPIPSSLDSLKHNQLYEHRCQLENENNVNNENDESDKISLEEIQNQFFNLLCQSVKTRVTNIREYKDEITTTKIGILFSGGIDSVMIAALAHRFVPTHESIDLINVAFGQQPSIQNMKKKHIKKVQEFKAISFDVPDRVSGKEAMKELPSERKWNFIEVNVDLEELQNFRKERVSNLVYPLETVLDDSIGCAIWFASRGKGIRYNLENGNLIKTEGEYTSPVKVLLCGMGADEQLGGYARHRTRFEKGGWTALTDEMNMEVKRISTRNLGRDDRCISDHGKESRFPFLDESLAAYLQELPTCVKCDPRLPRGQGEKILLREVASSLGLHYVSSLPKRAIQFGSKIAKLESGNEKGSDTCIRLK